MAPMASSEKPMSGSASMFPIMYPSLNSGGVEVLQLGPTPFSTGLVTHNPAISTTHQAPLTPKDGPQSWPLGKKGSISDLLNYPLANDSYSSTKMVNSTSSTHSSSFLQGAAANNTNYQLPSLNSILSSINTPISRNFPTPSSTHHYNNMIIQQQPDQQPQMNRSLSCSLPVGFQTYPPNINYQGLPVFIPTTNVTQSTTTKAPTVQNSVPLASISTSTSKSVVVKNQRENYTPSGNLRKHTCKTCGKGFTTSGHLARHNRIHTGVKNHVCSFEGCDARFSRHDNCMQHYKIHLKSKKGQRKVRL